MSLPRVPLATSMNHHILFVDRWNSESLMKTYLKSVPEPSSDNPVDVQLIYAQAKLLKISIRDLEDHKIRIAPRWSYEINTELATQSFRRKVLLWSIFPVNALPGEILSNIFRYVIWTCRDAPDTTLHRLYVTWVCRRWRDVAIGDQTLWTSIWFRDAPPWNRSLAFLERAGTAPLDLRINEEEMRPGGDDPPHITPAQINWLLDIILRRIASIRTVVISVVDLPPAILVLHKFRNCGFAASLERFELHRSGTPPLWTAPTTKHTELYDPIPLCNGNVPKLNWLCLDGIEIDWEMFPASNLRTIDLRRISQTVSPSVPRWQEMLQSRYLFKLCLDAAGPQYNEENMSSITTVTLPNLREFLLGNMTLRYAAYILAFFDAPAVRNLIIIRMAGEDFGPLIEMITGRFREVRLMTFYTVEIKYNPANRRRMVKWLESMPKLQMLKIAQIFTHVLYAFLEDPRAYAETEFEGESNPQPVQDSPRPVLCPKLEFLHFQIQDGTPMRTFLEGRHALGVPFSVVYVTHESLRDIPETIQEAFVPVIKKLTAVEFGTMVTPEEAQIREELDASIDWSQVH
ncbi:hypothetical protein AcW2_000573 [Taiwanofungus camphoratus]|nr:hypothetical protein AcW2_000573 [Antrodia cinnamomea]